jgi:hypothetical protein
MKKNSLVNQFGYLFWTLVGCIALFWALTPTVEVVDPIDDGPAPSNTSASELQR